VIITHTKVSTVPDGPDTGSVRPSDWNAEHAILPTSRAVTGDFTLLAGDNLGTIKVTSADAVTATLPNDLPVDFNTTVLQLGTGAVIFQSASGAALRNRLGHARTAGNPSLVQLHVETNADDVSASYVLSGDTAA
jgi:hypothetical protein